MPRKTMKRDRGQTSLEYSGLALLIAAVVAALVLSPLASYVAKGFRTAICIVTGGTNCSSSDLPLTQRPDKYYRPKYCLTDQHKTKYGAEVSVIATVGGDIALVRQELSNGKVRIRAANMAHVGIEFGIGADAQWGKVVNAGAEANIGAQIEGGLGHTWVFDNSDEADRWIDNIRKNNRINAVKKSGLLGLVGGGIYDAFDDSEVPKKPKYTRYRAKLEAQGSATANAGVGLEFQGSKKNSDEDLGNPNKNVHQNDGRGHDEAAINPEVGVGIEAKIGGEVIVRKNNRNGSIRTTFQFTAQGSAGANVLGHNSINGVPIKGRGKIQGAMKVTRNSDGEVAEIRFVTSVGANGETTVTTTVLALDTPRKQRIAQDFLNRTVRAAGTGNPTGVPWIDTSPTAKPGNEAPAMQSLMYREGKITRAQYKTNKSPWKAGAEGKYGVKFGLGVQKITSGKKLESAKYLGAARDGKRSFVPYTECVK